MSIEKEIKSIVPQIEAATPDSYNWLYEGTKVTLSTIGSGIKTVASVAYSVAKEYGPTIILTTGSVAYNVGYGVAKLSYYAAYPYAKPAFNYCVDTLNDLKDSMLSGVRYNYIKAEYGEFAADTDYILTPVINTYEETIKPHIDNAAEAAHELSEYVIDNAVEVFDTLDEYSQEIGFDASLPEELMHDACGF